MSLIATALLSLQQALSGFFQHTLASSQVRVTCIGDSITQGGGCESISYVDVLADILGKNYVVTNAGISSITMLKEGLCNDLKPCSYWNTDAWKMALDSSPNIVTIMLGTNDAKTFNWEGIQQNRGDYYALDYIDMIKQVSALPTVSKVFVMVPPPLYPPYPFGMNKTVINQILPRLARDIAAVAQVEIIDIFSALSTKDLTCDGCHPTHDGNVVIAETVANAIQGKL